MLFRSLGAWRQQIPTQSAIANAALQQHCRSLRAIETHGKPDAKIRTDGIFLCRINAHPLVVVQCANGSIRTTATHDSDVANMVQLGPVVFLLINKVWVATFNASRMLQTLLGPALNVPFAQHVGLPHHHIHLDWT